MFRPVTSSRALHYATRFFSSSPLHPLNEKYDRWARQQMLALKGENRVRLVQTDGAGTVVDKYCLAPLNAFRSLFARRGFELSHAQITGPMGIKKIKHIEHLLFNELNIEWQRRYGKHPNDSNVVELHDEFTKELNNSIAQFSAPTPYVDEAFKFFKDQSLLCALTTGYSRTTADLGMSNLYRLFDATTTADEVAAGTRMAMIKENMSKLKLSEEDMKYVIFFTDASSDLSNLLSAVDFPWVFGVSDYSTHVGISSEAELAVLSPSLLSTKREDAKRLLLTPRPHAVIKNMSEACLAVAAVNDALSRGKTPSENRSLVINYPTNAINDLQEPQHESAKTIFSFHG
jgi:phosphonoacetaldehyde hydrolase